MPTGPPAPQDHPQVDKAAWRDGDVQEQSAQPFLPKLLAFRLPQMVPWRPCSIPSPKLLLPSFSLWLKQVHSWMAAVLHNLDWRMKSQLSPILLYPAAIERGEGPSKTHTGS